MISNMDAEPLLNERHVLDARTFVEIVVWRLPRPLRGSTHRLKYWLALVRDGVCVLRCDNEAGKGDHRICAIWKGRTVLSIRQNCWPISGTTLNIGGDEMKIVTLQVASLDDVKRRAQEAFRGRKQGARITFASPALLFKLMTAKRWELIRTMTGAGPLTIREAARRVKRDVKAVHGDVHALLNAGILQKTDDGTIVFPYDAIRVDVMLSAA